MLVLLIFAPSFASPTTSNLDSQVTSTDSHVAKRNANHSQSDIQLTYEELEKEEESCGEQRSKQSVVNIIANIFTFSVPSFHDTLFSFVPLRLIPLHAHIYLRRSLRI
jgi:hypothetical protein